MESLSYRRVDHELPELHVEPECFSELLVILQSALYSFTHKGKPHDPQRTLIAFVKAVIIPEIVPSLLPRWQTATITLLRPSPQGKADFVVLRRALLTSCSGKLGQIGQIARLCKRTVD